MLDFGGISSEHLQQFNEIGWLNIYDLKGKIMRKINIPSFIMCIFALLLSTTHAYSSSVDFEDYMPDSRNVILIKDSPQDDLRWAYDQIRQRSNFDDFIRRSTRFEDYILDPIDMNNIPDQTEYIAEARSLKDNLIN